MWNSAAHAGVLPQCHVHAFAQPPTRFDDASRLPKTTAWIATGDFIGCLDYARVDAEVTTFVENVDRRGVRCDPMRMLRDRFLLVDKVLLVMPRRMSHTETLLRALPGGSIPPLVVSSFS